MLYTHLGRIVAALGLLFGIYSIYHSWSRLWGISGQPVGPVEVERAAFLTHQMETGILIALLALAVGILTEISRSVRANVIDAKTVREDQRKIV